MEYKQTIHLPQTDFPMKADLAKREPGLLARWQKDDLYGRLRAEGQGRPAFVLLDGPPYANGAIHLGHAVNKVLKDIIVKSRRLDGRDAPYVPGWDCHGLPIEHQVEKVHGRVGAKLDAKAFRAACRAYAAEQVDKQRRDFERLGVLGDWHRPYLTMLPGYEAAQLRAFARIYARGHVYKGFKPVYWCLDCRSSLAEAEVEYEDRTSPSVDAAYAVVDPADLARRLGVGEVPAGVAVAIWTTTPWTLPASQGVTVHPEFDYALIEASQGERTLHLVVAKELVAQVETRLGLGSTRTLAVAKGAVLERLELRHPFYERTLPVILGEHVTLDQGTGCVHTAPGHGLEDYQVGIRYGLPVDNPVGGDGRFLPSTPLFAGQAVFAANDSVIDVLREKGTLLAHAPYRHSYPHCWRHHKPLIFRATPQWFISMEQAKLRAEALAEIRRVEWMPGWGENRIYSMIENRPDWCISRQRTWGVPIPFFLHRETGEPHPDTVALIEQVARRVESEGIDGWFDLDAAELLGADAAHYEKSTDVMDVWVDSGLGHTCVRALFPEMTVPADLYLEGSDQHRGWFHSSLLTSVALTHKAPYRAVLTHGFTVDEKGRKMSKSLGNTIVPQTVIDTLGADVLRLWVAATDYANEMSVSDEILKRMADSYRRMRNTLRYLLGNLAGFDPAADAVAPADMVALDRWALARTATLQAEVVEAYRTYQFHLIYQKVHNFCVVDLGAFYLDVLKDRLYTMPEASPARRSAQTALWHLAHAMVRWLAPILSFTAEEAHGFLPATGRLDSVFLEQWHALPVTDGGGGIDWDALLRLKTDVQQELERLRNAGQIGGPLDASIDVWCAPGEYGRFAALGDELRFALISSEVRVHETASVPDGAVPAPTAAATGVYLTVRPNGDTKCVRCWQRRADVGSVADHPELCGRCAGNVAGPGEQRRFA